MHAGVMEKQKPHEAVEAQLEKKEEKPKRPYAWERTGSLCMLCPGHSQACWTLRSVLEYPWNFLHSPKKPPTQVPSHKPICVPHRLTLAPKNPQRSLGLYLAEYALHYSEWRCSLYLAKNKANWSLNPVNSCSQSCLASMI